MSTIKVDTIETLDGSKSFNVADLSDATYPIEDVLTSTNTNSALSANQGRVLKGLVDDKQDTLVSGTSIKTINGTSLLGSGDLTIGGAGTGDVTGPASSTAGNFALFDGTTGKLLKDTGVKAADFAAASHAHAIADVTGLQTALDGKVVGPASATNNAVALFDGTTGKLVKDSTKTLPTGSVVGTTDTQTLSAKTITGLKETKVAMGASDIDLSAGNVFTKTISGTTSLTVSNVPAAGTVASFILKLTNGGSATVNWFSGVKWPGGTAPTLTAAGRDNIYFETDDGGTTWDGSFLKDVK